MQDVGNPLSFLQPPPLPLSLSTAVGARWSSASTEHFGIHKNGNLLNKPAEKGSNENHNINYEAIGVIRLELMLLVPRRIQRASPDSTLLAECLLWEPQGVRGPCVLSKTDRLSAEFS